MHARGFGANRTEGIIPAPSGASDVGQEEALGGRWTNANWNNFSKQAYDLVVAKLPASRRPGASDRQKAKRGTRK